MAALTAIRPNGTKTGAGRAAWFQYRVRGDEARLEAKFGADYTAYRAQVKRWIPGLF